MNPLKKIISSIFEEVADWFGIVVAVVFCGAIVIGFLYGLVWVCAQPFVMIIEAIKK